MAFRILAVAGSLRQGSYNRALIRAAAELAPEGVVIEVYDLKGFPEYNAENESPIPSKAAEFKAKIRAADALLIATPEYNHSFPGVLKNALDWASRPSGDNAWSGKVAGIMSASTGMLGGFRAQNHLRGTFVYLNVESVNKPEVMVSFAAEKIKDGRLVDEKARELIRQLIIAVQAKALKLRP